MAGCITPVSLIQTFGNLLEQSPLPPIDTVQEFSQFAIARTFPTFIVGDIEALPHHLIRGNKYPLLILGPDAGPSVALKGDDRCIEFHLGHSVLPLWPAPLLVFVTLPDFCWRVWRSASPCRTAGPARRGLRVVAMVLLTQPQEAPGFRYFLMVAAFAAFCRAKDSPG